MYLESGKGIAITLHPGDCNPASTLPLSPTVTNSLINPGPFPARQPIDSAVSLCHSFLQVQLKTNIKLFDIIADR